MLTAAQLDVLPEPILALYRALEDSVLEDMARGLAALTDPAISRAAWQMQRLTEAGAVYEAVLARLSRVTGTSEALLREMFEQAGVRALRFDDAIYRAAGLDPLPLNLSPAMAQVLRAGLEKTGGLMRNLTQTTAVAAQTDFIAAADLAYLQVASGAFSYQDALRQGVTGLADGGLRVIHYASGRRDPLDVALRRTLLTGVNQTVGRLQEARADALGTDLVQTSAHIGARPSHAAWQGQVFSRRGRSDKYPSLVAATGYGTAAGLCGINCRHSFFPFFEGLSPDVYQDAGIDPRQDKTVSFEGESMTVYEATQKQRALERSIRQHARRKRALDAVGLDATAERQKLADLNGRMRDFTRQTGLKRQAWREQVFGPPVSARAASMAPAPSKGIQDLMSTGTVADEVRIGTNAIERVHQVDRVPDFAFEIKQLEQGVNGDYYYTPTKYVEGKYVPFSEIRINLSGADPSGTFVHEFGHHIDRRAFEAEVGGKTYASDYAWSTGQGPLAEWWRAVKASPEYEKWMDLTAHPDVHAVQRVLDDGSECRVKPNYSFCSYARRPNELWARSYAQYIGVETEHDFNHANNPEADMYPLRWSDETFEPIRAAIDALFRQKGWKK